jgi:hypothetical protein
VHKIKELSPRNSTDAERQIDVNDEHPRNAHFSIRVSFEPDSNVNEQSESQEEKLPAPRISILRDKVTLEADPKYRITEMPSKLSRKSPRTQKSRLASSTVISDILVLGRAKSPIICSEAGRQIDSKDEQSKNVFPPIRVSFDTDSNVSDERDMHDENELSPRDSTDAGRQIDLNDEHCESAQS